MHVLGDSKKTFITDILKLIAILPIELINILKRSYDLQNIIGLNNLSL
jgi:hypothetical protein